MEKGYIQIYCGEGKGKTSALNGMVIRGLGNGFKIRYVRFLKNRPTSENKIFEQLGIKIESFYDFSTKFVWEMNPEEVEMFKQETRKGFEVWKQYIQDPNLDMVFADEMLGAVQNKFIGEDELIDALKHKAKNVEVVISGRYTFPKLVEVADLVSEVKPIKHYFDQHVNARPGIEY